MVIFDTNAVLRYILQDNLAMADEVEAILSEQLCFIPTEVIAEMVYVLSGVYKAERTEISDAISGLLELENMQSDDMEVVRHALIAYSETKLDFVDCLMIGYSGIAGNAVFTFDKKLKRHLQK